MYKNFVSLSVNAGFQLMDHSPYSPGLTLTDSYLFRKLKESLGGIKINSDDEVMSPVEQFFCDQDPDLFQMC